MRVTKIVLLNWHYQEKKEKDSDGSWHRKLILKVRFWHFLKALWKFSYTDIKKTFWSVKNLMCSLKRFPPKFVTRSDWLDIFHNYYENYKWKCLKVSKSQKEFFLKHHCSKYERNIRQNSALWSKGRILPNISFVFWAMEFQEKMLLRFTDLKAKRWMPGK